MKINLFTLLHKITPLVFPNQILKSKTENQKQNNYYKRHTYFIYSISITCSKNAITITITHNKNTKLKVNCYILSLIIYNTYVNI